MSYGNVEAVTDNSDCKIIEKIIEIRTVVPDNLCNICFQSCFNTAFTSFKDYAVLAHTVLQAYAPYIMTFAAGGLIATVASNKAYFVKSSKAIVTILFAGLNTKADIQDETINKYPFQSGLDNSYSHVSEQIPLETFISATEYKSESSFSNSPIDNVYMNLNNNDINLDFIPD